LSELSNPLKRICLSVLLTISSITVTAAQQQPNAGAQPKPKSPVRRPARATSAHLGGVNIPRTAACPVRMNFAGTITADGPTEVKYTWASSDGGTWPEGTLKFAKAGTEKVGRQLQMGAAGDTVHGWLQIKVLSPDALVSNKAGYSVKCESLRRK
jgi:hypothetical protein